MSQVETLPQSMADTKTLVLMPQLDQGDVQLIGEKIKPSLFSKFGFKPKPVDIRLLASETYFEPYLIIAGKYVLDYCRRHIFKVNVKETTTKVFIAGQEFRSEQSDPKVTDKVIKMTGEEYVHHERQAYYILDRFKREIPPEKLPVSPFETKKKKAKLSSIFKSMSISDEIQIEFLKSKIAQRPADVAEIIKEVFDITERTIDYYPMYQLTFENTKSKKCATIVINGITGEMMLNGTKRIAVKTIVTFSNRTNNQPLETPANKKAQTQAVPKIFSTDVTDNAKIFPGKERNQPTQPIRPIGMEEAKTQTASNGQLDSKEKSNNGPEKDENVTNTRQTPQETMALGFPALVFGEIFSVGDNVTAVVGNVEIPSDTKINKTLVVKGTLKIGDNCRVHGKLKALKEVSIGTDTIIDGDLISGGDISIGSNVLITGIIQAAGHIKVSEHATIEQGLYSNPNTKIDDIQLEVNFEEAIASVARQ